MLSLSVVKLLSSQVSQFNLYSHTKWCHTYKVFLGVVELIHAMHKLVHTGSVHTTPDKFENGAFSLKTNQFFSVQTTREKLSKRDDHQSLWRKSRSRETTFIIVTASFSKNSVFKMFSVHTRTQSWRFQISPV